MMMKKAIVLAGGLGLALVGFAAEPSANAIRWVDGTWDESGAPKGKMLTSQSGWWGDRVKTDVTYEYEKGMAPTGPMDWDALRGIGNRALLRGMYLYRAIRENYDRTGYNGPSYHYSTVGSKAGQTISAIFDFKRTMVFNEIDVLARGTSNGVTKIAFSNDKKTWAAEREEKLVAILNRYRFKTPMRGRYLRIRFISKEGPVRLNSVIAWGDSADGRDGYEDLPPINAGDVMQFTNVTAKGIAILPMSTPRLNAQYKPKGTTPDGVALKMARDEFETRYFAVVNGAETETTVSVAAPDFGNGVSTELLIGGVLRLKRDAVKLSDWDKQQLQTTNEYAKSEILGRGYGIRPFLPATAMPPRSYLRRYFANVDQMVDFPRSVTLKPHEGCVVMLRMKTEKKTAAGLRRGTFAAGDARLPIALDVVDLTLPQQPWVLSSDSDFTAQFPFETRRRFLQDTKRYRESGSTTVQRLPDPGSKEEIFMREVPGAQSVFYNDLWQPPEVTKVVNKGAYSLTNEVLTAKLKASVAAFARRAVATGYPLDRFIFRTKDEPNPVTMQSVLESGLAMKEAVPGIRVAVNPCAWHNGRVPPESEMDACIDGDLYARVCDVSCPISSAAFMRKLRPKLYAPNRVNGIYEHPGGCFSATSAYWMHDMGLNGWRYYAYAELHSSVPFDVTKAGHPDMAYTTVYPLEYDVALTPQYEACRECSESIRLIQAVLDAGDRERYKALRKQFDGMVDRTFDRYSTGKPNGKTPTEDGHPDYLAFREKLLEKYSTGR